jgi:hypothetical protein
MFACHGSPAVFRAFCKMRLCSIRRSPLAAVIYEWGPKKSTPAWPVDVSRGTKLGFAPAIERAYGVYVPRETVPRETKAANRSERAAVGTVCST